MNRLFISAAHKSSGKTTVCIGLCAALRARGEVVQPFKKGPDYIDPLWLGLAAGRPCYSLDAYLMGADEIRAQVAHAMRGATLGIVEGNKGLYDGLDLEGSNSNAAMAALLGTPVVLVIDARGMTRGIAPLILGYQAFDRNIRIAGVILNQLGGSRHEAKLRAVIEHYTGVPVLGAVQHDERVTIPERHLGLVPSNEAEGACSRIDEIAARIAAQVDLDQLLAISRQVAPLTGGGQAQAAGGGPPVRIGIARDAAFGFYYPGDLDALRSAGAELVSFDALQAAHVGSLGYKRNVTPTIDAMAKEGFNFTNNISTASWTVPASMTWFTGVYPSEHRLTNKFAVCNPPTNVLSNLQKLPPQLVTLAEVLKQNGYATGGRCSACSASKLTSSAPAARRASRSPG